MRMSSVSHGDSLGYTVRNVATGRQRSWLLHIGQAKQLATRLSRIEKARSKIIAGKGLLE